MGAPLVDPVMPEPRCGEDALDAEALNVAYEHAGEVLPVVNDVSISVAKGEVLAIVGESGSGKSSLVRAIGDMLPPNAQSSAGRIALGGVDLVSLSTRERRRVIGHGVGFVLQNPHTSLNPALTVGRQGSESLRLHRGLGKREALRELAIVFEQVGLTDPEGLLRRYPHQLSGGMAQRVCIAMAVSTRPALLIADEPTASLDSTIADQVLRLLRGLQETEGMGMILVTHNLAQAATVADRIAVMYAGRILEEGPASHVVRAPRMPYTSALIDAVPVIGREGRRLVGIPGQPPSIAEQLAGCEFRPRCISATARCSERPEPLQIAPEHTVRCWHPIDVEGIPGARHA